MVAWRGPDVGVGLPEAVRRGGSNISVVNYASETTNVGTPALPEVMAPEIIRSESRFSVPYNEERDAGNS